jgi:pimeloyl-ACP methyl ester carboxylesterase
MLRRTVLTTRMRCVSKAQGPTSRFATGNIWVAMIVAWLTTIGLLSAQESAPDQPLAKTARKIETTDYLVPHISTVPANAGKRVELFVREKVESGRRREAPVVLMIGGATISAVPDFDLEYKHYSWMDYLARAGFDAFAMDFTGYGLSPRPMMDDPCNNSTSDQQSYLVPKPLAQPCSPSYPFMLTSLESDFDEIDRVVDYLREIRDVDKVTLIAWSRGGNRAGGYTARHQEKVEKLFLYAPGRYMRLSPSDPPVPLPLPGVPSTVVGVANLYKTTWDINGGTNAPFTGMCDNQFDAAIRPVTTATQMEFDPLGSTWGTEGVRRSPLFPSGSMLSGWNATFAAQITVPTLIIRGDLDTAVPLSDIQDLLGDLTSVPQKIFIHVACASHYLVWENQHMILLRASVEWLQYGTFARQFNGSFAVDAAGHVHQEQ